jgi:hypothetical protein
VRAAGLGFGAEWDSADYTGSGVTEQDLELIAHRIQWMKPPIVRVMMLTKWALVADGQLDFATQEMHEPCRPRLPDPTGSRPG